MIKVGNQQNLILKDQVCQSEISHQLAEKFIICKSTVFDILKKQISADSSKMR